MGRPSRYSLALIETTSIPLLLLTLVMMVTGYTLAHPETIPTLLPPIDYSTAQQLHTDPIIRTCYTILATLHSTAGTIMLIEKHVKRKKAKILAETLTVATLAYIASTLLLAEILAHH